MIASQHEHKHQAQQSPHINFDDLEEFDEDLPYETGSKPITSANNKGHLLKVANQIRKRYSRKLLKLRERVKVLTKDLRLLH